MSAASFFHFAVNFEFRGGLGFPMQFRCTYDETKVGDSFLPPLTVTGRNVTCDEQPTTLCQTAFSVGVILFDRQQQRRILPNLLSTVVYVHRSMCFIVYTFFLGNCVSLLT